MPELPEVETIVRGLKHAILGRKIEDVWSDATKLVKKPSFNNFKKGIKGKRIKKVWRRGKNVLIDLSDNKTLLVHQKITGHLLLGRWKRENNEWSSLIPGPLADDVRNRFLHLVFTLDNGKMLALSDLRKFAKVELWETDELKDSSFFKSLGPEPLDKSFSFDKFKKALKKKGKTKQVLMDQTVIAGIGNIYSDEILFLAKIHPLKDVSKLSEKELKRMYLAVKKVLSLSIRLKGTSVSDYRTLLGEKGEYQEVTKVYRKEGKSCPYCQTPIKRVKVGGRSAHFCPKCQPSQ